MLTKTPNDPECLVIMLTCQTLPTFDFPVTNLCDLLSATGATMAFQIDTDEERLDFENTRRRFCRFMSQYQKVSTSAADECA